MIPEITVVEGEGSNRTAAGVGILRREEMRIIEEIKKLGELADVSGQRGTSARNLVRYALSKTGRGITRRIRATTPRGPTGNLRRSTYAVVRRGRKTEGMWFFTGWRANPQYPTRYPQRLAVEYGTRKMEARETILRAKQAEIGGDGMKFQREFNRQLFRRIDQLAERANARLRARG